MSASHTSHSLIFLDMYTNYTISIIAFNPAGEGPESESVNVRTLQGIPGPPANLKFSDITMTSLKVSWEQPEKPNGEILGYIVSYETAKQDESKFKQKSFFFATRLTIPFLLRLLQASEATCV